jgi:carboxypeptidase Q
MFARYAPLAALLLACAPQARPQPVMPPAPADSAPVVAASEAPAVVADKVEAKAPTPIADAFRADAERILKAGMEGGNAFAMLRRLTDHVGHRAAGSPGYTAAVAWATEHMKAVGLENVRTDGTQVKVWNRGQIAAEVLAPARHQLDVLALGNSPGTGPRGVTGDIVVVKDFEALDALGEAGVKGKIVLFNHAMPAYSGELGSGYGEASRYRTRGPARAAKLGASAVLVRSATARSLATPHTGVTLFEDKGKTAPAAAISLEGAELLSRLAEDGPVKLRLVLTASTGKTVAAPNVIGELRGREKPEEIVLLGAHLDSWDLGQGAHDDGAGCAIMLEAVGILKRMGLSPRRTIRVVLFSNEERGLDGSVQYGKDHAAELARHVGAIESDGGGFAPWGFSYEGKPEDPAFVRLSDFVTLFAPLGATRTMVGWSGSDLKSLEPGGVPRFAHVTDGATYFDIHHTAADTLDKVNPEHVQRNAAMVALFAWIVAELPVALGAPI